MNRASQFRAARHLPARAARLTVLAAMLVAIGGGVSPSRVLADHASSAYPPGIQYRSDRPHPAVARIIVPEGDVTSYGSGTLVDVRDNFGLVITNWHVVRDGRGDVEVVFPDGFRSKARPLKVDEDWDLAALVIWRPPAPPVSIAARAPQSGDQLTICGYGQGQYRAATGRCTQYYAPKVDLPQHMVELDVEARQGDSGGPIFNDRGELAGVLFGAGGGTTLGSFGGQVESFLATLAPDIGRAKNVAVAQADTAPVPLPPVTASDTPFGAALAASTTAPAGQRAEQTAALWQPAGAAAPAAAIAVDNAGWHAAPTDAGPGGGAMPIAWFETSKNLLAVVGIAAIVLQALRMVR